jgi:hypothetical protein
VYSPKRVAARSSSWFSRKVDGALQVVHRRAAEVGRDLVGVGAMAEQIVELLVVGVVEPERLELGLVVPVHLGHEHEIGPLGADRVDGLVPELARVGGVERRLIHVRKPVVLDVLAEHQHRHVAAHAVDQPSDALELLDQVRAERRVGVVELDGVVPA